MQEIEVGVDGEDSGVNKERWWACIEALRMELAPMAVEKWSRLVGARGRNRWFSRTHVGWNKWS